MSPDPSAARHHRADTTPAPRPWLRGKGPSPDLTAGSRLAVQAVDLRRNLDTALEIHGSPCQADPEAWFPDAAAGVQAAADACLDCRAFLECGAFASAMNSRRLYGVWAGELRGNAQLQIIETEETGS